MPGRVSTRSTRASTAAGSTTTTSPRKSTIHARPSSSHRVSSPQLVIPAEGESSDLRLRICSIFTDAQATNTGHRKLVINLRKLQGNCCYASNRRNGKGTAGAEDEVEEATFNEEVGRCVIRLMGAKKSESVGDRVVRFLGLFLTHASEKGKAHTIPYFSASH